MELILIKSYKHLSIYEKEWSEILADNKNTNPFIEYEFVYNWWRFLGEKEEVEIYAVKENNKITAFFPFQIKRKWFGSLLHFLALGDANYMDIVVRNRDKDRLIMFVFDSLIKQKKHIVFSLHGLLESLGTSDKLSNYLKARSLKEKYRSIVTPYIDLQNLSYDEYMNTRKKLHGLDRREKKLRLLGEVRLEISPAAQMERIFDVHKKRWEKKNDTSGFSSDRKKAFFRYLAEQSNGEFGVRLTSLSLEDEIIAFTYGFSCRERYLDYVLGHDPDFDVYSPGRVLVKEKIKKSITDGFQKLDMSIGYEPYKFDWNTDIDYTRKTIFSTNTLRTKIYRNFLWAKEYFISNIRKHYSLVSFRRNTLGKIQYYLRNEEKVNRKIYTWYKKVQPLVYERKQYYIAKLSDLNIEMNCNFQNISSESVLNISGNRNEILQKIFNGYKGYYNTEIQKAFWINENLIRLDDMEIVINLKKKSVYIRDWENEDLEKIISFVQIKYHPQHIFIHINKYDKGKVEKLKSIGFQFTEMFSYSRIFGKRKIKAVELI